METMLNVKIVILVALGLGSAASSEVSCDIGDIWKVECNTCICNQRGVPKCTALNCHPDAYHVTSTLGSCKPLSRWRVDCNYCTCSEYGVISCTNNICDANELTSDRFKRQEPTLPSRDACKPGVAWKDDCNRCFCKENGKAECTKLLCFPLDMPERRKRDVEKEREEDKEVNRWPNIDACDATDGGWETTGWDESFHQGSVQSRLKRLACTEGETWMEGCNQCHCTQQGTPACTKKLCVPEEQTPEKRQRRSTCTAGETWKQGCNECHCSKDGKPACTRKMCSPEEAKSRERREKSQGRCEPGTKWKDDCNDCVCTHTGYASCTLKACSSQTHILPIKTKRQTQPNTGCKPGSNWKDDCNDCVCTHTGYAACTLKSCDSQTQTLQIKTKRQTQPNSGCKPGSKWKDDCNDCVCTHTGYAACTLKACDSQTQTLQIKTKRQTQPNSACTPGSKWKEGCNNCTCLANGTGACTRRICRRRRDTGQDVRECRPAAKMCGSTSSASESQSRKREGGKLRGRGRCTPGSTWIQNCSQCYCDEQNNVECVPEESCSEDQATNQGRNKEEGPKGRGRCEPGSTWEIASRRGDWCNLCACDANGNMNCTIRPCQKIENTSKLESETRRKRATLSSKKSERWCKPGDMYYFTCDLCPCGLKGITGCNSRTCRDRTL